MSTSVNISDEPWKMRLVERLYVREGVRLVSAPTRVESDQQPFLYLGTSDGRLHNCFIEQDDGRVILFCRFTLISFSRQVKGFMYQIIK